MSTHGSVMQIGVNPPCYIPSANPRSESCLRCGKLQCRPKPDQPVQGSRTKESEGPEPLLSADANQGSTRPRDITLERDLTLLAAKAAGFPHDFGLRDFADKRAWPGGVRKNLDFDQEVAEEIADASSYCTWRVERIYDRVLAGDPAVLDDYERFMRVHSKLIEAWRELLTGAA